MKPQRPEKKEETVERAPRTGGRRKVNPLYAAGVKEVTYKDVTLLKYFVSERGRILPRRLTGIDARQQRMVAKAVKQARLLGLLPYLQLG
ncbi:MAG: 30S ribosomal protein S18 [Archangium sp.]